MTAWKPETVGATDDSPYRDDGTTPGTGLGTVAVIGRGQRP